MGKAVPTRHPAVVLRSNYRHLRALLVVAMIAVAGLTAAAVILANDRDEAGGATSATPIEPTPYRYGGFNPATGRPESAPLPQQEQPLVSRYDGGPEEGTAVQDYNKNGATGDFAPAPSQAPGTRYDGGPEEGSSGALTATGR